MYATTEREVAATSHLESVSDAELVYRYRSGNDAALELLLGRHSDGLYRFCCHLVGNREEAEDICQEALARAITRVDSLQSGASFKSWLFSIARNLAMDSFRSRKRLCALPDEDATPLALFENNPQDRIEISEEHQTVAEALRKLVKSHQQVLMMREVEGLSYAAIAQRLDVSQSAVETLLFRARRRLKEEYGKRIAMPAIAAISGLRGFAIRVGAPIAGAPLLAKVVATGILVGVGAVSVPHLAPVVVSASSHHDSLRISPGSESAIAAYSRMAIHPHRFAANLQPRGIMHQTQHPGRHRLGVHHRVQSTARVVVAVGHTGRLHTSSKHRVFGRGALRGTARVGAEGAPARARTLDSRPSSGVALTSSSDKASRLTTTQPGLITARHEHASGGPPANSVPGNSAGRAPGNGSSHQSDSGASTSTIQSSRPTSQGPASQQSVVGSQNIGSQTQTVAGPVATVTAVAAPAQNTANSTGTAVQNAAGQVQNTVTTATGPARSAVVNAGSQATGTVNNVTAPVQGAVNTATGPVQATATKAGGQAKGAVTATPGPAAVGTATGQVKGVVGKVTGSVPSVPTPVIPGLGNKKP